MSSKDDSGTLSLSANSLPQLCIKILNRSLENTFLLSDPFFIQTIPLLSLYGLSSPCATRAATTAFPSNTTVSIIIVIEGLILSDAAFDNRFDVFWISS